LAARASSFSASDGFPERGLMPIAAVHGRKYA
jgi:hypothetical protein